MNLDCWLMSESSFKNRNSSISFNKHTLRRSSSTYANAILTTRTYRSTSTKKSYQATVVLRLLAKEELLLWSVNLRLANGRSLMQKQLRVVIQKNTPMKSWGTHCDGISNGGKWIKEKAEIQISILELIAILTFMKTKSIIDIHLKKEKQNKTAVCMYWRWGWGAHNKHLLNISKSIWQYLF